MRDLYIYIFFVDFFTLYKLISILNGNFCFLQETVGLILCDSIIYRGFIKGIVKKQNERPVKAKT